MATYVISDIHGQYNMFIELLDKIDLKDTDTLYILGDVLDRGPHPIKTIRKLMEMPNAICLVGNHEFMAMKCLEFLMKEITDKSIEELDDEMLDNLETWQYNGSRSTVDEFTQMDFESKKDVIDFIKEFLIYEEVSVNDKNYLVTTSGKVVKSSTVKDANGTKFKTSSAGVVTEVDGTSDDGSDEARTPVEPTYWED